MTGIRDRHPLSLTAILDGQNLRRLYLETADWEDDEDRAIALSSVIVIDGPDVPGLAVAIFYNRSFIAAPLVTAVWMNEAAPKLVEVGEQAGVPVIPNAALARALGDFEPGDEIPKALYALAAHVLVLAREVDRR